MTREPYATPGAARGGKTSPAVVVGIVVGMIVLAGGVMLGLLKFAGPKAQPAAATQPADGRPTPVLLPGPALATSANDILVLFKDQPAAADEKYKGMVVDVTGSVFNKSTSLAGERAIMLEGGSQARFAGVRCVIPAANQFQLGEVEVGQTVTVRGRCQGRVSDVVLQDCAVLKVEK